MTPTTLSPSKPQPAASADWPADALPEHWIDSLFQRMEAYYGAKVANAWAGVDRRVMKRTWAAELAGLSNAELRTGVSLLKTLDWPPTLPEFLKLCRPPVNYDAALYEAVEQLRLRGEGRDQWTNPAIYWAAVKVGEFDMLNLPQHALLKRFSAAMDEVLRGPIQQVPPRAPALPPPGKYTAPPEVVAKALQGAKAVQKQPGNKQWAEKVLRRFTAGEKLAPAVVQMARAALRQRDEG